MKDEYKIIFLTSAKRDLKKLDRTVRDKILTWIYGVLLKADYPRAYGKALSGEFKGLWRYRVGNYRLIAEILDKEIIVKFLSIGHRSDIYKRKK